MWFFISFQCFLYSPLVNAVRECYLHKIPLWFSFFHTFLNHDSHGVSGLRKYMYGWRILQWLKKHNIFFLFLRSDKRCRNDSAAVFVKLYQQPEYLYALSNFPDSDHNVAEIVIVLYFVILFVKYLTVRKYSPTTPSDVVRAPCIL